MKTIGTFFNVSLNVRKMTSIPLILEAYGPQRLQNTLSPTVFTSKSSSNVAQICMIVNSDVYLEFLKLDNNCLGC